MTTDRERFMDCMEYRNSDRRPNHELGIWPQAIDKWEREAPGRFGNFKWDWFSGEDEIGLDRREFIQVNYGFIPPFEEVLIEETERYEIMRNSKGIVTKALKEGSVGRGRMCMDQYLEFPVKNRADFAEIKKRLVANLPQRYPADMEARIDEWNNSDCPVILGVNCIPLGYYWLGRELMGTEQLSVAFYDDPELIEDIMEFHTDFLIEVSRPVLEKVRIDYFNINEDFAMKGAPLIGPNLYKKFIYPRLKRLVEFFRSYGTPYFSVDSDGDPTALIPLMMDAGVNVLWPIERASDVGPLQWRKRFGKQLRLWGGVDKRVLPHGPKAIRDHLAEFIPLIEEGGFIPTLDHCVPPDISWENFQYYMEYKEALLAGDFAKLR